MLNLPVVVTTFSVGTKGKLVMAWGRCCDSERPSGTGSFNSVLQPARNKQFSLCYKDQLRKPKKFKVLPWAHVPCTIYQTPHTLYLYTNTYIYIHTVYQTSHTVGLDGSSCTPNGPGVPRLRGSLSIRPTETLIGPDKTLETLVPGGSFHV